MEVKDEAKSAEAEVSWSVKVHQGGGRLTVVAGIGSTLEAAIQMLHERLSEKKREAISLLVELERYGK